MFYIPDDWLKDKENKSIVHEILNEHVRSDLRDVGVPDPVELAIKKLTEIGETIIVEKINNGRMVFGG